MCIAKKYIFNVLFVGVQTYNFVKCKKFLKTVKILKNDGHFQISHPQISLKQFLNIRKNAIFFLLCRGMEK